MFTESDKQDIINRLDACIAPSDKKGEVKGKARAIILVRGQRKDERMSLDQLLKGLHCKLSVKSYRGDRPDEVTLYLSVALHSHQDERSTTI
jgi:hypothetical protein